MTRVRIWLTAIMMATLISFWPIHVESKQYFDADLKFKPMAGVTWNYQTYVTLIGTEIQRGSRSRIGGIIYAIYDETINSSGGGLVNITQRYHQYESFDISQASQYEDPMGGPMGPPDFSTHPPDSDMGDIPSGDQPTGSGLPHAPWEPVQSIGGGGGGGTSGGDLIGEAAFDITPILESNIRYVMSESGRILSISGMERIGEFIDPSRSITMRQIFQTNHLVVLPDYRVHLNETWRAPMIWTVPLVGETLEIPLTFTLVDIRTTYRFRVAAIDFNGLLQFDVDVSDEGMIQLDPRQEPKEYRKESNIKGDIVIQGRAYVDLDRGITVAYCDTPLLGYQYFLNHARRGHEWWLFSDIGLPGPLNPGFYARLDFERRDLYTPLGNVIDPRQDLNYIIQNLQWFTMSVVE
ncbi:MAG TPA: hypothetical protein ENN67_06155 [Firmicutes bacterium]|nr:hypothetical protein [Bacillota bacterium]